MKIFYYFWDQYGGFGGGGRPDGKGNCGGGGYTGGNGAASRDVSGGGGGSFLADPNGTRQLDWYENGSCSMEYIGR